jgi:transposase-like protein
MKPTSGSPRIRPISIVPSIKLAKPSTSCYSPKRDLTAAKLFLRLALCASSGIRPRVVNVDGHPAYARAIAEVKESGELGRRCLCRTSATNVFAPLISRSRRGAQGFKAAGQLATTTIEEISPGS